MKKSILGFVLVILALGSAVVASNYITPHMHDDESVVSHSGRTNSTGCHNDYIHGGYHCH